MNWIEVKDNMVQRDTPVLVRKHDGSVLKGSMTNNYKTFKGDDGGYLLDSDYTHYCIITEPSKGNHINSIKYHLKESEDELEKWDGRKDITYSDTTYNAASVNFGKVEALKDCLRILYNRD